MYSAISSTRRHHFVIEEYWEDVLRKLADTQQNHPTDLVPGSPYLLDLLPDHWVISHLHGPSRKSTPRLEKQRAFIERQGRQPMRAAARNNTRSRWSLDFVKKVHNLWGY
jgi:hypothetical protein